MRASGGWYPTMKLATYKDGSRDGQLVVVSRDLVSAHYAAGIATRLQQVLDDWNFLAPQLQDLYETLSFGKARHAFPFEPQRCMAPLPRAFLCVLAVAGGDEAGGHASSASAAPLSSDPLAGGRDDAVLPDTDPGTRRLPVPALAVLTGDIPARAEASQALEGVRLLMLAQGWRDVRGVGSPAQAGPAGASTAENGPDAGATPAPGATIDSHLGGLAFGPVAVTPDELGSAWRHGRLDGVLQRRGVGRGVERLEAGLTVGVGDALAALARRQPVRSGALIVCPWAGADATPAAGLKAGDASRLSLALPDGSEPFGTLEQTVTAPLAG